MYDKKKRNRMFIYIVVMLCLIFALARHAKGGWLMTQCCRDNTILVVGEMVGSEDIGVESVNVMQECTVYSWEAPRVCYLDAGRYVITHWSLDTHDLMFYDIMDIADGDKKYFAILDCGEDT